MVKMTWAWSLPPACQTTVFTWFCGRSMAEANQQDYVTNKTTQLGQPAMSQPEETVHEPKQLTLTDIIMQCTIILPSFFSSLSFSIGRGVATSCREEGVFVFTLFKHNASYSMRLSPHLWLMYSHTFEHIFNYDFTFLLSHPPFFFGEGVEAEAGWKCIHEKGY